VEEEGSPKHNNTKLKMHTLWLIDSEEN